MPRDTQEWWVYILRCRDGTLYTGITTDPERRLAQHNAGTAAKYTRARRPVVMVYREPAKTHGAALRREFAIKKLSRAAKVALIASRAEAPPAPVLAPLRPAAAASAARRARR